MPNSTACPGIVHNNQASWEPLQWKVLQQAKTTVTTHGIRSEAAQSIIQFIFTADALCPNDCTNIASLPLTPSQYLLWEREWKRLAPEEANKHQDQNDPLYGMQPDMLTGNGNYATTATQLTFPTVMHQISQNLAYRALLEIPEKKKNPLHMQLFNKE